MNGDGLEDIVIGAAFADPNGITNAGKSYVIFGKQTNTPIAVSSLKAGIGGFTIEGVDESDISGLSVIGYRLAEQVTSTVMDLMV